MSCGLTLQICLIIALSLHCNIGGLALSMAKSHWHVALRSVHAVMCLEREVAGRENWLQLLEFLLDSFYMC